jgi:small GTP-binding protein
MERPPIVVIMGHVDHGKSTLLDFIRKSNIVAGEAGGITQHVAAYEVEREKDGQQKRITFIDTPGHAAFGAIRARGANVADIAVLVVAADDGVKAQTIEALNQIRDAKIPFIVAINKIDKPNADINRTQASLMEKEVFLEKLGGDVPWAAISAKNGTGVDELLDLILVLAELSEFKADLDAPATGYVIEAHRAKIISARRSRPRRFRLRCSSSALMNCPMSANPSLHIKTSVKPKPPALKWWPKSRSRIQKKIPSNSHSPSSSAPTRPARSKRYHTNF